MNAHGLADVLVQSRYSDLEKQRFSRIIREFNELYYQVGVQTWSNMSYRGVNVLKTPTDMWIYQELIHKIRPDVIIECGTLYGGSALYLVDTCETAGLSTTVISIDVTHEKVHNTVWQRVEDKMLHDTDLWLFKGSSTSEAIIEEIHVAINCGSKVMVILDSDHTYNHVRNELDEYGPLVTKGSALIVEDTHCPDVQRAIQDWYVNQTQNFKPELMCEKFMLTFCRDGFFERIK